LAVFLLVTAVSAQPPGSQGPLALDAVPGASWSRALTQVTWSNRDGHAAVVFKGKLWVLGGWGTGPLNDVWSSEDGVRWTSVVAEAPWAARKSPAAVVFQDRVWLLGGSLGQETVNDVWSSTDGAAWKRETASAAWPKRHNHAAVAFDGRLWILGGWGGTAQKDLNDVWSSRDGLTWTRVVAEAPWSPRNGHTALVHGGRLWLMGGWGRREDGIEGNLNDVWSSKDGVRWDRATARAPWAPRNHHTAVDWDGRLWVLGGWGTAGARDGNLNDVWSSEDGATWRPATGQAQWLPRNGHASVVFQDKLWVIGGWSHFIGGTSVNDLWYAGK
jgi:N-acetylneuraminic acid mutarotase